MAAQTPKEIARARDFSTGSSSISVEYLVETTALTDGAAAAEAAVIALGSPSGHYLKSIRSDYIERNPLWYKVVVTHVSSTAGGATSGSPLDRPSILSSSYEEWTEAYFEDETSPTPKLVTNSMGERFESLPERKRGSLVLQVTKNFASFPADDYDNRKFTTNSVAVPIKGTIYPIDSLLFLPPTVQETYETVGITEYHYYATTFRLAVDAIDLHKHKIEDRGFVQQESLSTSVEPILDEFGFPVREPWPLNGSGVAKNRDEAPAVLTFSPYASMNWGIDFS